MCTLIWAWTEGSPVPDCEQIRCEDCPYWMEEKECTE